MHPTRFVPLLTLPALLLAASMARAGDAVEEGMALFKAGDYAKVVITVEEVAADDPAFAKARYLLGEAYLALGDPDGAEKAFRESLEKKPQSVPVLTGLGRALAAKGSHDEAMRNIQAAIKLDAKDAAARRALGECLAAQNKPTEARKELEAALKLDPKDPLTARAIVEVALQQGDTDGAAAAAKRCLEADPKAPMGAFLRALVFDRTGKDKEAIEAYEAALSLDPKFLDAHKNLAILCVARNPLYKDAERTKKAMEHFAKYFELGGADEELRQAYQTMKAFLDGQK